LDFFFLNFKKKGEVLAKKNMNTNQFQNEYVETKRHKLVGSFNTPIMLTPFNRNQKVQGCSFELWPTNFYGIGIYDAQIPKR